MGGIHNVKIVTFPFFRFIKETVADIISIDHPFVESHV